jgi:hypothetical protein
MQLGSHTLSFMHSGLGTCRSAHFFAQSGSLKPDLSGLA